VRIEKGGSKEPRYSWRGFLNKEDFCSSATLQAVISPRSSEQGVLEDFVKKGCVFGLFPYVVESDKL
jgi:hypothetical protein